MDGAVAKYPFNIRRARLGELLVQRGIIQSQQLDRALEEQKKSGEFLGKILILKGWASEENVARALSEQNGLAFVDLKTHPAEAEACGLIPESVCRSHHAVPLFTLGESLTVAMENPLDPQAVEDLQQVSHKKIRPVFATPSAIQRSLEELPNSLNQKSKPSTWSGSRGMGVPVTDLSEAIGGEPVARLRAVASLAPVVQMVDAIIHEAVLSGASDIHLEPSADRFHCRFRVDGILRERPELPKEYQAAVVSRIKIMADMDIAEKRLPQDGRIQMPAAGRSVDLRVSTFPTLHGENVVIRILDRERGVLTMEQLGFSKGILEQFNQLIDKPHGIILVTGPTGSGKTTTLYAALNRLNRTEKNIMTLEDPVEYELPRVRQSQVNVKAGLTFATGLRSMVRQDPDIVLIGEIRDQETADIAIHASLTGHLVFSTLHTNDAASAATRLEDIGVEPFLVSTSLAGILAQRLVRCLCPACKIPQNLPRDVLARLGYSAPGAQEMEGFREGEGCSRCRQTGYSGRVGLFELLIPNDRIREMIAQKAAAGVIQEEAIKNGMVTLRQDGIDKLLNGITSLSEVLRVVGQELAGRGQGVIKEKKEESQ